MDLKIASVNSSVFLQEAKTVHTCKSTITEFKNSTCYKKEKTWLFKYRAGCTYLTWSVLCITIMMHYDTVLVWLQLYPFGHSHVIFAQSRKKKGKDLLKFAAGFWFTVLDHQHNVITCITWDSALCFSVSTACNRSSVSLSFLAMPSVSAIKRWHDSAMFSNESSDFTL